MRLPYWLVIALSAGTDPRGVIKESLIELEQTLKRLDKQSKKDRIKPEDGHKAVSLLSFLEAEYVQDSGHIEERNELTNLADRLDRVLAVSYRLEKQNAAQKQPTGQKSPGKFSIYIISEEVLFSNFLKVEVAKTLSSLGETDEAGSLIREADSFYRSLPDIDAIFEVFRQRRIRVCQSIMDEIKRNRAFQKAAEQSSLPEVVSEYTVVEPKVYDSALANEQSCIDVVGLACFKIGTIAREWSSASVVALSFRILARDEWSYLISCQVKKVIPMPIMQKFSRIFAELHHGFVNMAEQLLSDASVFFSGNDLEGCKQILDETSVVLDSLASPTLPLDFDERFLKAKSIWSELSSHVSLAIANRSAIDDIEAKSNDPVNREELLISLPILLKTFKSDPYDKLNGAQLYRRGLSVLVRLNKM